MAWTTPMTAVANATFTAAQFNAHVRDNLNETAPAKATTAGRIFVSSGANAIVERAIETAAVATNETTTSTSFTDIATSGPAVTVTTGVRAIVILTCRLSNSTSGQASLMGYVISGASTQAGDDDKSVGQQSESAGGLIRCSTVVMETGLTAGSNVFTSKYRVTANTGTFGSRRITVIGL